MSKHTMACQTQEMSIDDSNKIHTHIREIINAVKRPIFVEILMMNVCIAMCTFFITLGSAIIILSETVYLIGGVMFLILGGIMYVNSYIVHIEVKESR